MGAVKYEEIYKDLKGRIENEEYEYQELIPSENTLVTEYSCSRNTVRRAIARLADIGYVQSIHGKGVVVIYQPAAQAEFMLGGIESLKEAAARNNQEYMTRVICFAELNVDKKISKRTGYPEGTEIYYVQRIRYIDGEALIIDHNYFRRDIVRELTAEIAEQSVYEYMEQALGEDIVTTKRRMTVERVTEVDEKYMKMNGYNCVAVVSSVTFNAQGIMFEFTQSRHHPDRFAFFDQAKRVKP